MVGWCLRQHQAEKLAQRKRIGRDSKFIAGLVDSPNGRHSTGWQSRLLEEQPDHDGEENRTYTTYGRGEEAAISHLGRTHGDPYGKPLDENAVISPIENGGPEDARSHS